MAGYDEPVGARRSLRHPTVIVAFGDHGLRVLELLLTATASRGTLVWDEASQDAGPDGRRLRDLRLVHVPWSSPHGDEPRTESAPPNSLIGDLLLQIQRVEARDQEGLHRALSQAVLHATDDLLHLNHTRPAGQRLRAGLDVLIIAPVRDRLGLAELRACLERMLPPLARHSTLEADSSGARLFNAVLLADFDDYFQRGDGPSCSLRAQLHRFMAEQEARYLASSGGLSRVFLFDGKQRHGVVPQDTRAREVSLLIEFLLFEGIREDEGLRMLLERSGGHAAQTPLGSVSVRLVEHGSDLLRHLTAASFGVKWLAWMRDGLAEGEPLPPLPRTRAALERIHSPSSQTRVEMQARVEDHLSTFQDAASSLTGAEGWAEEVLSVWTRRLELAWQELGQRADEARRHYAGVELGALGEALSADIREALLEGSPSRTDPAQRSIAPLGGLIRALELLREDLRDESEAPKPTAGLEHDLEGALRAQEAAFLRFEASRVNTHRLHRWWFPFALLLGFGLGPLLAEATRELYRNTDPTSALHGAVAALVDLSLINPADPGAGLSRLSLVLGVVLAALFTWGALHRPLAAKVARAKAFFTRRHRGRFYELVQSGCGEGGAFRAELERAGDRLLEATRAHQRREARRAIDNALSVLRRRLIEAEWLRAQLTDFQRLHGIDPVTQERREAQDVSIRAQVEERDALKNLLGRREPSSPAYQEMQRETKFLEHWGQEYDAPFLDPIGFLQTLTKHYIPLERQHEQQALARSLGGQVAQKLKGWNDLSSNVRWPAEGVKPPCYVAVSSEWFNLTEVERALRNDIGAKRTVRLTGQGTERCYVLLLQLDLPLDRLFAEGEQAS